MSDDLCLSIDLGTGGPKIGLVSLDGEVLDYELHSVTTTYTSDGGATQDPAQWWTLIGESTRRLMDRPDVTKDRVKAVAVTGQYASRVGPSADRSRATARERFCPSCESPAADPRHRGPTPRDRSST